jgi:hypothetical protein
VPQPLLCNLPPPHDNIKYPWPTIVFGHDMILNVNHETNWEYICAQKQNIRIKNNKAENAKRIPHTYNIAVIKFCSKERKQN